MGFAGWKIDKGFKRDSEVPTGDNKEYLVEVKPKKAKDNRAKLPRSLDIHTWAATSEQFATEKQRVFQSLEMVWRKSILIFELGPTSMNSLRRFEYDIGKPFIPT